VSFRLGERASGRGHQHGVDPEFEFIEKMALQQRLAEKTMTVDDEVIPLLLL
jgi:hypothetical protein